MLPERRIAILGAVVVAAVAAAIVAGVLLAWPAATLAAASPAAGERSRQENAGGSESAAAPMLDSPSPTCYRPAAGTGACYIEWGYLLATTAPGSYVISMTVTIDDLLRAYHGGFFQTAIFIPADMTAPGYKVICGTPREGEPEGLGRQYAYAIRTRDTTGMAAVNLGAVSCPADIINLYLPLAIR